MNVLSGVSGIFYSYGDLGDCRESESSQESHMELICSRLALELINFNLSVGILNITYPNPLYFSSPDCYSLHIFYHFQSQSPGQLSLQ